MLDIILKRLEIKKVKYQLLRKSLMNDAPLDGNVEEAMALLESISPNPGSSCMDRKNFGKEWDLEVIIPAYNVEKYIQQCLDSVISQKTNFRFHVTCINDGSTDNTGLLLRKYENAENVTIIHQENKGFSGARNVGLRKANGKYIMFVDSDDFIPPGVIQRLLECAFDKDADIVCGSYEYCNVNGKLRRTIKGKDGVIDSLDSLNGVPWGKIYKSNLFSDVSFPEGYWYEDSIMRQVIFPCASSIYSINEPVYCWRVNPLGVTSSGIGKKKCIDSLWITMQLYKDRLSLGLETDQSYYDYILRMARLTYLRSRYMPENIKKAVFIVFSDFVRTEFQGFHTEKYQDLEFALLNEKYGLYIEYCEK